MVRHVAAGLHLTVAVTTGGRVFQMGCTGATPGKHCPWEGAAAPELVKGALAGEDSIALWGSQDPVVLPVVGYGGWQQSVNLAPMQRLSVL